MRIGRGHSLELLPVLEPERTIVPQPLGTHLLWRDASSWALTRAATLDRGATEPIEP